MIDCQTVQGCNFFHYSETYLAYIFRHLQFFSALIVADEFGQFCLEIEGNGKPFRVWVLFDSFGWTNMVVFFSGLLAAANHTQQVLDGQNVLEGELVHPQRVLRLTQTPVTIPFLQCINVAHDD